jgi:aminopeptidase N
MRGRSLATVGGLLISLALCSSASAQFTPGARTLGDRLLPAIGNGGYDVQHYDLTIAYDPAANSMVASADLTIRATQGLSDFSLDLRGFTVAGVTIDGVAATVARDTDKLIVTPAAGIANNRVFHAIVAYSGTPAAVQDPDGSFEGWVRITNGGFVVNEPMGAMGWFPNNNHPADKATYDFHLTVPNTQTALGNGELVSKDDNGDGTSTWNWHMGFPMASYLSTSTVGVFAYTASTGATALGASGQPLQLYDAFENALSTNQKNNATIAAARQDGIVRFISDTIGAPYPFDSHGVVLHRNSLGYALEVQTKSHFSGTSISLTTLAHEVAHQWFGNSVTLEQWSDIWFAEGWATWWAWYWNNKRNNNATTVEQQFANQYATTNWGIAPAALPSAANLFDTFPVYNRPAAMLEGYRQIVGDAAFFHFQRLMLSEHGYGGITLPEFVALAKRAAAEKGGFEASNLGKLDLYFDQWLFGTVKPALNPTTFFLSTDATGGATGTVPATLGLTLGAPASFGAFTPGVAGDYAAGTTANVISSAGDGALSVTDPSTNAPGRLVNGAFALATPLQARAASAGGSGGSFAAVSGSPLTVLTYSGPVSNDAVTIDFQQSIGANEALRTGAYGKTLTFTLSTATP